MITAFKTYTNTNKNLFESNNNDIENTFKYLFSKIQIYGKNKFVDTIIKTIKSKVIDKTTTTVYITLYNGTKIIVDIDESQDKDMVKITINGVVEYNRSLHVGFNYTTLVNVVRNLFLELLDTKGVSYSLNETKEIETTKDGEIKLVDDEWEIEQVISIFTENDPEYANTVKENAIPLMTDMVPKDVKRGDTIYITAMFKPKNNSAAYLPGQLGVLQVRVVDIFMGLSKLKQINKKK